MGAEAVVKGLVDAGAIGLVTTHDLTLADDRDDLGDTRATSTSRDHFEDGAIAFDYRCGRASCEEQRAGADAGDGIGSGW